MMKDCAVNSSAVSAEMWLKSGLLDTNKSNVHIVYAIYSIYIFF